MIRSNSRRRASRSGPYLCVAACSATLLLLLSLVILHSRLSSSPLAPDAASDPSVLLLDDADNDAFDGSADDRIDVFDRDDMPGSDDPADDDNADGSAASSSAYFWDHLLGVKRRAFGRRQGSGDDGDEDGDIRGRDELRFASDDLPVDGDMRARMASIRTIEDALLVKKAGGGSSPLREGWAKWFEAKGRFLRQDRMFGPGMEALNPMNHPLLHEPDAHGQLTRGDRLVRKAVWKELEAVDFPPARSGAPILDVGGGRRRTSALKGGEVHPDGKRWGYYPGIDPHSSFSDFMERFLGDGMCGLQVFMVWNSPPWMYGVRHQRGLESLFHQHKDACVVVFSETMDLDFFKDFVEDGFKIAVALPNLDELLRDTPLLIFSSIWAEWRRTTYYPIHYSELVRLAALFKYGGLYLDSDIIVLKSLKLLEDTFGMEGNITEMLTFSGAVMAFQKHSPFILECMHEFYSTYNDTSLRWNGAELLHRVVSKHQPDMYGIKMLKRKHLNIIFPISSLNITRYFTAPADDAQRYEQDTLLKNILDHSITFHFWNSMTSALVPERGSLVERLLNHHCLYCLDIL